MISSLFHERSEVRAFGTAKGVITAQLGKESKLSASEATVLYENLTADKKKI